MQVSYQSKNLVVVLSIMLLVTLFIHVYMIHQVLRKTLYLILYFKRMKQLIVHVMIILSQIKFD